MTDRAGDDGAEWVDALEASDPDPPRAQNPTGRRVAPWPAPSAAEPHHEPAPTLASQMIGLTVKAARKRLLGLHPNFHFRIVDYNGGETADFRPGRMTLYIRNGRVVDAVVDGARGSNRSRRSAP